MPWWLDGDISLGLGIGCTGEVDLMPWWLDGDISLGLGIGCTGDVDLVPWWLDGDVSLGLGIGCTGEMDLVLWRLGRVGLGIDADLPQCWSLGLDRTGQSAPTLSCLVREGDFLLGEGRNDLLLAPVPLRLGGDSGLAGLVMFAEGNLLWLEFTAVA